MSLKHDIRDIASIDHNDVIGLNFIASDGRCFFRRHFRQGLRSHVMEVLDPADIEKERSGIMVNGTLHFPRAIPKKVLRIFRSRFTGLDQALGEIQRVKLAEQYLTPEFLARSVEIIVEYHHAEKKSLLLCGLQEYVVGDILDPWNLLRGTTLLTVLYDQLAALTPEPLIAWDQWLKAVHHYGSQFAGNIRKMITEGKRIPDLAGLGNVLITPSGRLKLVDINNISEVILDDEIRLDDRNYPVCDKSIEALALIEEKIFGRTTDLSDPIYRVFLAPARINMVKAIEKRFIEKAAENTTHSGPD